MLKMKLPGRTAEEGGMAEDEQDGTGGGLHIPGSAPHTPSNRSEDAARTLGCPLLQLDKEAVFEWFGLHLSPARRIEFMCGLLHMCQPLELRFLGSCLEDLARKDFHVLRDFEIRANSPSELGLLADIGEPVVRSKLLVSLSLLGSENRECAGILFRILSHVDSALSTRSYGLPVPSRRDSQHFDAGRTEPCCGPKPEAGYGAPEQLALLFTMASLHPAFPFHQRETIRVQLEKVEKVMEEERRDHQHGASARNKLPKRDYLSPGTETKMTSRAQSPRPGQPPARSFQKEAVYIEKIVLRGVSRSRTEREYSFVLKWSDSTSSNVTKTHLQLENFLLKFPKEQAVDSFEKAILRLLSQGDVLEGRELEGTLRERFLSTPPAFRKSAKVCSFFLSDSSSPGCSHCEYLQAVSMVKRAGAGPKGHLLSRQPLNETVYGLDPGATCICRVPVLNETAYGSTPALHANAGSRSLMKLRTARPRRYMHMQGPGTAPPLGKPATAGEHFVEDGSEASRARRKESRSPTPLRLKDQVLLDTETQPVGGGVTAMLTLLMSSSLRPPPDMESFILGYRKKPGSRSPSLGLQGVRSPQTDSRRPPHPELNGVTDWRRKNPVQKSGPDPCGAGPQKHPSDEKRSGPPAIKSKARASAADREKLKKPEARAASTSNGVGRPGPPQLTRQTGSKGLGPDAYGETSSESYSPPSSPQHDGRESLESEDEKDRETDSNSDDSSKGRADSFLLSSKPVGGAVVATVRPMLPGAQRDGPPAPPELSPMAFMQPVAFVVPNGTSRTEKPAGGVMVPLPAAFREPLATGPLGDVEKHPPAPPSQLGLPAPASPATQPLVQRFKMAPVPSPAPGPPNSEGGASATVHQPPMGAISVIPPSPAYVSPLQAAFPSTEPSLPELHPKAPGISLPSALPSSYSLAAPTLAGPPASSATSTPGQSQAATVPTHVPGPAPTPNPALTHSPAPQPPQPGPPQPAGCSACGCRGSCGNMHPPSYCYAPQMARQAFSMQPFLHLTSLCAAGGGAYLSQGGGSTGATQLPFFPAAPSPYGGGPLLHTPSEPVLGAQAGYGLQHLAAFGRFYQPLFPSVGVLPGLKKGAGASCYNCGVSGHYAQDCKQPSIDAAQQGGFRLKIVGPHASDGLDKAD
ncbi:LOW QUALITY PROTEIN: zinc finger CCHC domain-containing protein 2-like [Brienomyrus brachyistius]|uniref:LOW QUALITY PROTEIN: zinc finger CCHC domain-containing protein 2-like n=1 Tax=Brienomyrus brachyistius TaxID=42636 RepID=UPI0020B33214|nr:LOW QUALITY PROTEIN: zinc finger CCHC domain-containing protein 2-like [Brienomyrus brachyistius]